MATATSSSQFQTYPSKMATATATSSSQYHPPTATSSSSSSSSSISRRQKTSSNWHLCPEDRITPSFNALGQPIGDGAVKFATAKGIVARMGNFCPINIDSWRDVPKTNKEEMFRYMKERFNLSTAHKKYVLKSINASWKDHKIDLRRTIDDFVEKGFSWQTISSETPDDVEDLQLKQFVHTYLVEKRAEWINKTAKGRQYQARLKEHHTCGRKSFACRRQELGPIGEVRFYQICHTKKDESMNEFSSTIVEKCNALVTERTSKDENVDRLSLEEEVVRHIRGPDYSGRVRGLGRGPTPSSMQILNIRNVGLESQKAEIERQRAEIEELKKRDVARDAELKDMREQMKLLLYLQGVGNHVPL